jgi:hypothetical protein
MVLAKQPFTLPLAQGMNQKKNPKVLTGGVTLVENGVHRKDEELKKRFGWTSLPRTKSDSSSISAADAMATYESELLIWSQNRILTWSEAQDKWYDRGAAYSTAVSTMPINASATSYNVSDSVYASGAVLVCYEISIETRYQIYDYVTGAVLKSETQVEPSAISVSPKCVSIGGLFFVIYAGSTNVIKGVIIDPTTGAVTSTVTLASDCFANNSFDAIAVDATTIMLVYSSTTTTIEIKYLNTALGQKGGSYTDSSTSGASSIPRLIPLSSSRVLLAYKGSSNIMARVISSTGSVGSQLDTGLTGTNATQISGHLAGTDGRVYVQYTSSPETNNYIYKIDVSTSGGAHTSALFLRSVGLATRGFVHNGQGFVGIFHKSDLQSTFFIADDDGVIVSRHQPGTGGSGAYQNCVSNVWSAVSAKYEFSITYKTRVISETDTGALYNFSGGTPSSANLFSTLNVAVTSLDFQSNSNFSAAELGGTLLIVGGVLSMYDGLSMVEHGFFLYPEGLSATSAAAGSVENGTYLICACYEWTDAKGNIHRSAPSIPLSHTVAAGPKTIAVVVPTLRLTEKKTPRTEARIVLYRTMKNQTGPFYRVTPISSPTSNSVTSDTVTINDSVADSSLTGREYLYTTGGILDNAAALPAKYIKVWRGRVVLAGGEDNVIQYSKPWQKGGPVEFAAENTLEIESDGGEPTGLDILDERLVLFKEQSAYLTYGEGPDASGLGGAFSPLTRISTCDVGCIDQQSTASLPGAIIFKSSKGYYLLGSDLAASYIGDAVEDYNGLSVTSATLFSEENEVRITNSDGVALVFNYYFRKWSVFTNHEAVDALRWRGDFVHLKSDGKVCVETADSFRDDGVNYDQAIVTGWQSFGDIAGFQRIYRAQIVGEYVSPVSLSLRAAYDFDNDWIDLGSLALSAEGYRWQFHMKRQKCESMRFKITAAVSELVLSGEGVRLTAMGLLFGIKMPLSKIPSSAKAGLTTITP